MQGHWALPSFTGYSVPEAEIVQKKESKRLESVSQTLA